MYFRIWNFIFFYFFFKIYKDSGEVQCSGEDYFTTEVLVYRYRNFFA